MIYTNYILMLEGINDVLVSSGFNGSGGTSAEFKYCNNKNNKPIYYKCMMNYFKKLAMVLQYKLMDCSRTNDINKCKETLLTKIKEYLNTSEKFKKLYLRELDNVKLEQNIIQSKKYASPPLRVHRKNRRRIKRVDNK